MQNGGIQIYFSGKDFTIVAVFLFSITSNICDVSGYI